MSPHSVTFEVPGPLVRFAGGRSKVPVEGESVGEALAALAQACPELGRRLLDDRGAPRRFVLLYLNGEDVTRRDGLQTAVQEGDRLTLLLPIAGG